MNRANYSIVTDTAENFIIRDEGPWHVHATVTNDAEQVVKDLAPKLGKRRLLYIDSNGDMDEIVHRDGKFVGFAGGPR